MRARSRPQRIISGRHVSLIIAIIVNLWARARDIFMLAGRKRQVKLSGMVAANGCAPSGAQFFKNWVFRVADSSERVGENRGTKRRGGRVSLRFFRLTYHVILAVHVIAASGDERFTASFAHSLFLSLFLSSYPPITFSLHSLCLHAKCASIARSFNMRRNDDVPSFIR